MQPIQAGQGESDGEDGPEAPEYVPLLGDLTSDNLDDVPVFRLTHALREDINAAVDTTLTWDQLKSPQLNSFLVRPLLLKCRDRRTRAIIFSLLTNCVQYRREAEEDAARQGVNMTRALTCELLAVKTLKEFSARELIDVLTFDFWPLQGDPRLAGKQAPRSQRISALELAIKAQAKKFLSSPLVVQVLENIWKGNIVFHGASDKDAQFLPHRMRKAAQTYDAREASIFKLSRLRVPRYRHWMQTFSFAILLGLVIAVLMERNIEIRPLEIVMVVYAIGFMIDEVVGLNDTGSSLFLSNLWNSFDMLTLLFFIAFFCLRVWGLLFWRGSDMEYFAYDLLAINTVFLTPRLFSALDHTRQFSQMLIAFQRMAIDLLTSVLFILIFFAGFFLALSLAFARNIYSAKDIAFKLLQLIFGFSPAAWELLPQLNWIGKLLLVTFMINTNFLVVTILVSVLSTTFANVISNAHEEHQYLFALNTILAVKSDALFFYQAPLNLIEWLLAPLALILPRSKYIRINRYFIKFTHFFFLAAIFLFERFYLRPRAFVPQDLLLSRTHSIDTMRAPALATHNQQAQALLLGDGATHHGDHQAEAAPQRLVSGAFFGNRMRRESDAQRNSELILNQVFNQTNHARRQQGYGALHQARHPGGRGGGVLGHKVPGQRTNDWVKRLPPAHVFSPGGQRTPSDGTPEQARPGQQDYFGDRPRTMGHQRQKSAPLRPAYKRAATTAAAAHGKPGLEVRQPPVVSMAKVQPQRLPSFRGSGYAISTHSDPEDLRSSTSHAPDTSLAKSPEVQFLMPILDAHRMDTSLSTSIEGRLRRPETERQTTMDSSIDSADRVGEDDSAGDEMDVGEETQAEHSETEQDADISAATEEELRMMAVSRHRRQQSSATIRPGVLARALSPQRAAALVETEDDSDVDTTRDTRPATIRDSQSSGLNQSRPQTPRRLGRHLARSATTHSSSTGTSNAATAIPMSASTLRVQQTQRRISGEHLPPLSSSLATQLALHETALNRRGNALRSLDATRPGSRTGSGRSQRPMTATDILRRDRERPGKTDDEGTEAETAEERLVSRVLLARVDQYASRIERMEGCLEQLVQELRRSRATGS